MRYAPLSSIPSHCWLRARFEQLLRSPENFWVKNPFVPDNTTKEAHFVRLLWNINSAPVQVRNIFLLSRLVTDGPSISTFFMHSVTWIQRKSHRFGQGAHVDWGKIGQDPAGLVLTLKTWALHSIRLGVGDVCFFLTMRCFNDAMFSNS